MNFIPVITAAISAFKDSPIGQKKVIGFNQNLGEALTSKTNGFSTLVFGYAVTLLSGDPDWVDRIIGNVIIVYAAYATFTRDTHFKKTP